MKHRSNLGLLTATVVLLLFVNVPHLAQPPFGRHSFRQCQTLSTIELFYERGIDILHPPTNYQGEPGVFVLELPLFQAIAALLYHILGNSIAVARVLNIVVTLASGWMVYLIARRYVEAEVATLAAFIFVSAPLNLAYMSSTLIDPLGVLLALGSFYACLRILEATGGESVIRYCLFCALACLTALIKALYLFPVIVALGLAGLLDGKRVWRPVAGMLACLALAGFGFLLWSRHASHTNNASFFTAGTIPTTLLGFSALSTPAWYIMIAKRLLGGCVGPIAGVLVVASWGWSVFDVARSRAIGAHRLMLSTLLSTAGYWVAFANINFPHDYYSLITIPFLSVAAAATIGRLCSVVGSATARPAVAGMLLLLLGLATATASTAFFYTRMGFHQSPELLTLQQQAGGTFSRWEYAMMFVQQRKAPGVTPLNEFPAGLYALGLRGTGKAVVDARQATEIWRRYLPHYRHLRYVIFFGLPPVPEITNDFPKTVVSNEQAEIYGFSK
jgi:4-amino-4-deoxy-L-arabinose transferase-like glycosyltransferase